MTLTLSVRTVVIAAFSFLVGFLIVGMLYAQHVSAAAPKITVGKFVYMNLDPKGIYTNANGDHYNYKTGYMGAFLRNGQIYLQTVDCGTSTSTYPSYPPCYYEYGVDAGTPFFVYGNLSEPSPQ